MANGRVLLRLCDGLGQPTLGPGRDVVVDQVLPTGTIEQGGGVEVRGLGFGGGGGRPDLLDGGTQLAPLGAIALGGCLGLAETLLG